MNSEQGKAFLKALGVGEITTGGKWLRARCPLARWTHVKGHDSTPSFGMTINDSGPSVYHCFACQSGSLDNLLQTLEMHSDYGKTPTGLFNFAKAREILDSEELTIPVLPEYSEFGSEPEKKLVPWDHDSDKVFPPAWHSPVARRYLAYRGFTVRESIEMGLRVDLYRHMLVFPYWNVYGDLCGMRGRLMDFGEPLFYQTKDGEWVPRVKHHDYTVDGQNNSYFCWLYEPCLNMKGTVVVVEGQFDLLRVRRVFPRVVANLTAKPSDLKLSKLMYAESVIIMLDGDETGSHASQQWAERLAKYGVEVGIVNLFEAPKSQFHIARTGPGKPKDPDEVDEGWLQKVLSPYL